MDALAFAFNLREAQVHTGDFILHIFVHLIIDQDFVFITLGQRFKTGSNIHRVAYDGIVHALLGADVSRDGLALGNANAGLDWLQPARNALAVVARQNSPHFERRHYRSLRIVFADHRRAKHRHHRVADKLVEHALVTKDGLHHAREVVVQHAHSLFRGGFFREAGEVANVGEKYGHRLTIAAEL